MEERKITSLPVVDADGRVEGVVHLHDLWKTERSDGTPARRAPGVLLWLLLAPLVTRAVPAGAPASAAGRGFSGAFSFQDDYQQYLSFAEQASRGALLFVNKYDPRPQEPFLLNLTWWAGGALARPSGARHAPGLPPPERARAAGPPAQPPSASCGRADSVGRPSPGASRFFATGGGLGWLRVRMGTPVWQVPDVRDVRLPVVAGHRGRSWVGGHRPSCWLASRRTWPGARGRALALAALCLPAGRDPPLGPARLPGGDRRLRGARPGGGPGRGSDGPGTRADLAGADRALQRAGVVLPSVVQPLHERAERSADARRSSRSHAPWARPPWSRSRDARPAG